MTAEAIADLTDPTTLRVAINMGNMLLVTGKTPDGDPDGVAPDVARMLGERLGVKVRLTPYPMPGDIADAMPDDPWDIALIAIEPKRAEIIAFSAPYVEIEGSYLVPADSPFQTTDDVDAPGVRIAVADRAAYDLYLSRTLKSAELVRATGLPGATNLFFDEKLDALAGLKPALNETAAEVPGYRVIEGNYTTVQQAIGTKHENKALLAFIQDFIASLKRDNVVAGLIDKHGVTGNLIPAP